jgi:hypothetical protein
MDPRDGQEDFLQNLGRTLMQPCLTSEIPLEFSGYKSHSIPLPFHFPYSLFSFSHFGLNELYNWGF